ncbi:TBC1 domain family member 14-like isoform X1 [Limulus polyphemus]|uniref:TBC1 domain family member 14-like isoform X1 n=1 Tax=Limulus polyphemus TaxID=6850 RepID=A0ABM1BR89_LIMPO|nr:TBC1 domain family member 14-like isoform X1 [Limulus polyphemus]
MSGTATAFCPENFSESSSNKNSPNLQSSLSINKFFAVSEPNGHVQKFTTDSSNKATLDEVLESIPLVYNPVTKQLHPNEQIKLFGLKNKTDGFFMKDGKCFSMDIDSPSSEDLPEYEGLCRKLKSIRSSEGTPFSNSYFDNGSFQELLAKSESSSITEEENSDKVDGKDIDGGQRLDILQRCQTTISLPQTDTSSFTSISSISTGTEGLDLTDITSFHSVDDLSIKGGVKPKRRGLSGLLPRNLLSWRSKELDENTSREPSRTSSRGPSPTPSSGFKNEGCSPATSTTALILENRPPNLPAKHPLEEQRHKQEYEEMVKTARKKELKDAKARKKQIQQQRKLEDKLVQATKVWTNDILPNWESVKNSHKTRDLWWQGIPPSVRGDVWRLAIGNELNVTQELYDICVSRSKEKLWFSNEPPASDICNSNETTADLIKLDVSRTFPHLGIFQEGGPYHDLLQDVLGAYVIYRPDIGYVQGMSFLAGTLLLNMEASDAFVFFSNLLNQPCQLAFFRLDSSLMKIYYAVYEEFFSENLAKLNSHFKKQNLTSDLYLVDWVYTLFSRSLPLDVACRVWDIFFRDGEEFLFRTALGILKMYEDILLKMDFIHLAEFLTKLPDTINPEHLFNSISGIRMSVNKKNFSQVLARHKDCVT